MNKITAQLGLILVIVLLLLTIFFGWKHYSDKINEKNNEIELQKKLTDALLDENKTYKNKEDEWVVEKLTLQESIKNLHGIYNQLSDNQKELIDRVKVLNKQNTVIAAALVQTQIKIDSLLLDGKVTIDTTKKTVVFEDSYRKDNKIMDYKFTISNVIPSPFNVKPIFMIESLTFPNKQEISFMWKDNKKKGYPVSFSITNSNDFFKTVNVDSYIIPEINKQVLDPNGWQKIGNFFNRNSNNLIYVGIGGVLGAGTYWYLTK